MRTLLLLLGFSPLLFAAGQPVIGHGDWYIMRNQVKFGATNSLVMTPTSTQDTASAWTPAVDSLSKPWTVFTLSYYGKATDGATSQVEFYIDSRYCVNAATGLGCDSLPTLSGEHWIYSTQKIVDTLLMSNPSSSFVSNTTSEFYIPHANSIRFRAHRKSIVSGKTVTYGGITLLGQ